MTTIDSAAGLRAAYREPGRPSLDKEIDHLDDHCRDFIAHATLVMLGSADADGSCDVSPRGGPAGFVAVLDDHRLAIPDLAGNNRLDSMENIVSGTGVGLLLLVPGVDETLRVKGPATITTDPVVLEACPVGGKSPRVAIVVEVATAFLHCAKALRRAGAWQPEAWPDTTEMATPACMLRDHAELPMSVDDTQAYLDDAYARTTWDVGGKE